MPDDKSGIWIIVVVVFIAILMAAFFIYLDLGRREQIDRFIREHNCRVIDFKWKAPVYLCDDGNLYMNHTIPR